MSISAEYDQHYMDNFNAMIEQEKQREQARRRKKEDLYFSSLPDWGRRKLGCITCGFLYSE